jgi:hypothetical protein
MSHCKKNQNHMLPRRFRTLIAGLLAISTGLSWGAENIGGAKQLFIDDRIIGSLGSAKRVFKQAVKTGPLLSGVQSRPSIRIREKRVFFRRP